MKALILVDIQNDFCPGGALAVKDGDKIIPIVNQLQKKGNFDVIVATQDWHPKDHGSFAANHKGKKPGDIIDLDGLDQILWPVHCVQESKGAEFHPALDRSKVDLVFQKGTDPLIDSYSGFYDNDHRQATGLAEYLTECGVKDVYVVGLATDYCVRFTALDAVYEGFETTLIEDACCGVELNPGDVKGALEQLRQNGVHIIKSHDVLKP